MSRAEELRAELAAAELEEEFLKAKKAHQNGKMSYEKYRKIKEEFHAARSESRKQREATAAAATNGNGGSR